jgi:hypothetical protein
METIILPAGNYGSIEIDHPTVIKAAQGARVTFEHIQVKCPHVVLWGLEFTNGRMLHGYDGNYGDVKLINCVFHDCWEGMTHFGGRGDEGNLEVNGCVFYNNGGVVDGSSHGHAVYSHNQYYYEGVKKRFLNNIFGPTYSWNLHLRAGSGENEVSNYEVIGNVFGNWYKGLMFNGDSAAHARWNRIEQNYFYRSRVVMSGMDGRLFDVTFCDNYLGNMEGYDSGFPAILMYYWQDAKIKRNFIHYREGSRVTSVASHELTHPELWDWDENVYYLPDPETKYFTFDNELWTDFDEWKAFTGYDGSSLLYNHEPTGSHVVVQPNDYDADRFHLIIYNWDMQDQMSVAMPDGIYLVRNAYNYYDNTLTLSAKHGVLTIPMDGWTPATPYGADAPLTTACSPEFRVFVLERLGSLPTYRIYMPIVQNDQD